MQYILLVGFLALLLLPYPLWWLCHGMLDTTNYENRTLAARPDLATTAVGELPAAIETWLEDNAPFRNQLMRANAAVNWALHTIDSSDVLLGKEGWLFLKDVSDSRSLSDYQGLTAYSEAQQAELLAATEALAQALATHDCELVILFAPAKEGVYAEYMPDTIPVMGETRVEALAAYLAEQSTADNLSIVWPKEALQTLAEQQLVYYPYDTHWNEVGGWCAAQMVLNALDMPAQSTLPAVTADATRTPPRDLAGVSSTWAIFNEDVSYTLDTPEAKCTLNEAHGSVTRFQGEGDANLLMVRDSFGEAVDSYLGAAFNKTTVIHGNLFQPETLQAYDITLPDIMVIEVAERYSDNLLPRIQTALTFVSELPA